MAYYALTSQAPFAGKNIMAILAVHANEQPVPPSQIVPEVDADIEQCVLKCPSKTPDDRFVDVDELSVALRSCR